MPPRRLPYLACFLFISMLGCGGSEPLTDDGSQGQPDRGATDASRLDALLQGGPIVDIRADSNRDGVVDLDGDSDDKDEHTWTAARGAVFLANIDDDARACPYDATLADGALALCNDAADEVVNGAADEEDLAPLRIKPWPDAPDDATWKVKVSAAAAQHVRLFLRDGSGALGVYKGETGTGQALRAGAELRIEAKDIVRDRAVWDGFVDVTLEVTSDGRTLTDTVRMRVAPLLLTHHLQPARTIFVARDGDPDSNAFVGSMNTAVKSANGPTLVKLDVLDQWAQDYFETGYMVMPLPGGKQKIIDVFLRSANVFEPQQRNRPLREAGRVVFTARGRDVAAIQEYDIAHDQDMDTLDSTGNLEVVPPHTDLQGKNYPFGRVLRGSVPSFFPDVKHQKMLDAQGVQPLIKIDTSWLSVGHVDETLSFIKSKSSKRGWVVLINDAAMAVKMLQTASNAGHRAVKMFIGKFWIDENNQSLTAETTIGDVLNDPEVMAASAEAAIEVQKQKDILKREVGLTDADFVAVPSTHDFMDGFSVAYQPGTVNGMVLSDGNFAAPAPHGPIVNGLAIFEDNFEKALAVHGVTVRWVENWNLLHRLGGEVHCGSNALRTPPADAAWWKVIR